MNMNYQHTMMPPSPFRSAVIRIVIAGVIGACNQPATRIAATVEYDDAWQLETLLIKAKDTPRSLQAQHDLTFVIPDDWAGAPVTFEMWGLVGGANKKAYATIDVAPVIDDTVAATLSLKLLDCSTPCTVGAVRCDGDAGVATCLAVEGCGVWSQPVACPTGTPLCSAGICAVTCSNECTMGTVQCDGNGATKACGQADADSCLDWQAPIACPATQTCSAGACSRNCTDECTAGATRCNGTAGIQTCGQADADGCLEWKPATDCPAQQTCSTGACRPTSCTPVTKQILLNPKFDSAPTGVHWTQNPSDPRVSIVAAPPAGVSAPSAPYVAYFGQLIGAVDEMSQQITIPATATAIVVSGTRGVLSRDNVVAASFIMGLRDSAGNESILLALSNLDRTNNYVNFTYTAPTALAGQTVVLSMRSQSDDISENGFLVDNMAVNVTTCE
jgi:hypothetical protein